MFSGTLIFHYYSKYDVFVFASAHVNSIFCFSGLNPTSADIILVPEACSENVYSASHLGFFPQFRTHGLLSVYGQLCAL